MTRSSFLPRGLGRDNRGTGAIELALILPILMLLLVGMIDVSRFVAGRIDAEQAAQRATDFALAVRPESANGTYIRDEAAAAAGVPTSDVQVDIFLECNGVRQSSFANDTCATGEDRARFVGVSVERTIQPIFDWGGFTALFGRRVIGSTITVTGDSLVRFQ